MTSSKAVRNWQKQREEKHLCVRCGMPAKEKEDGIFYKRCIACMNLDRLERMNRYYHLNKRNSK